MNNTTVVIVFKNGTQLKYEVSRKTASQMFTDSAYRDFYKYYGEIKDTSGKLLLYSIVINWSEIVSMFEYTEAYE